MSQHRLSRNMQFKLRGREYVIEKRLPDGTIRIKDIVTDERSAMPEQEIIEAVFCNNAELLGHDRNQDILKKRLRKTGVCDIACLKDDDPRRIELQRRISYVKAVEVAALRFEPQKHSDRSSKKSPPLFMIARHRLSPPFAGGSFSTKLQARM